MEIKLYTGKQTSTLFKEVAAMRLELFRGFPYLYVGDEKIEEKYFEGFIQNEKSLLVTVQSDNHLIACLTGVPLDGDAEILKSCKHLFEKSGYTISDFYYLGDFLVSENYRGKSLSRKMHESLTEKIREWEFKKLCLSTVERDESDPRKPSDYWSLDKIWESLSYSKKDISFYYPWPTITESGDIRETENKMTFWIREFI